MNNNSGFNTILLVVILLAIVGFGIWYFQNTGGVPAEDDSDFNLNVDLPENNETE